MPSKPVVEIELTPYFIREVKDLFKKYRHVRDDLKTLTDKLASGETPGDQIPGVHYPVFKVRVPNTDARRGLSGGYRVVYYLKRKERIVLITMYSKSEQTDISSKRLKELIDLYERGLHP